MATPIPSPSVRDVNVDVDSVNVRALVGGHDVTVRMVCVSTTRAPVLVVFLDGKADPAAWVRLDTGATGPGWATAADLAV